MRLLLILALSASTPSWSESSDWTFQRQIELPAHRSLLADLEDAELAPFETDGCSGGLSMAWRTVASAFPDFAQVHEDLPPWEACCVIHDRAYHNAGGATSPDASFDARLAADETLRACVIDEGAARRRFLAEIYGVSPESIDRAYSGVAEAMFAAVRFGGGPCTGTPWRWGFGFPHCSPISVPGESSSTPK